MENEMKLQKWKIDSTDLVTQYRIPNEGFKMDAWLATG